VVRPVSAVALALAALAALGSLAPGISEADEVRREKAVWVWEQDSLSLLQDRGAADEAIRFAKSQRITKVYLYADAFNGRNLLTEEPWRWHDLLRRLHREGLRAEALLGSAYLHTEHYVEPERRDAALDMFRRIHRFNAATDSAEERFDGIHYDIEPHLLPQWEDQRDLLLMGYLDLGRAIVDLRRDVGQDLPITPDIPFWLDTVVLEWEGATRSVAEHVIRLFETVALMDYRNFARGSDGIIAHATLEMDIAARLGRRVVIGLEIAEGEPKKISFASLTPADLARELAATESAFQDSSAFGGFAIHHFSAWKAWLERARQ
jgi:hypothetical protein